MLAGLVPPEISILSLWIDAFWHDLLSVCVCVLISSSYEDTSHIELEFTLVISFYYTLIASLMALSPNTVTFWGAGVRTSTCEFEGDTVQPMTAPQRREDLPNASPSFLGCRPLASPFPVATGKCWLHSWFFFFLYLSYLMVLQSCVSASEITGFWTVISPDEHCLSSCCCTSCLLHLRTKRVPKVIFLKNLIKLCFKPIMKILLVVR